MLVFLGLPPFQLMGLCQPGGSWVSVTGSAQPRVALGDEAAPGLHSRGARVPPSSIWAVNTPAPAWLKAFVCA